MDSTSSSPEPILEQGIPAVEEKKDGQCAKCEEYLAGWKRAQADYQNLQRDVVRDRAESATFANQRLLMELLPVLDQFALAMKFIPDTTTLPEESRRVWENWLTGMRAVQTLWDQLAQSIGLERIPVVGPFDPSMHEAMSEEVIEGQPTGTIVRVVADGWCWHGKVLRPARVILAK